MALFIISLASQSLVLLFVRGYYAASNTKKPLLVNVFSSLLVICFAYLFLYIFKTYPNILWNIEILLRVHDVPGTIMLALPLAYTLGSLVNFFLIWILFKKDFLNNGTSHLSKTFVQSAVGAMIMGFVAYLALNVFDDIFGLTTTIGVFMQGFLSGIVGISVGVFALSMMKNQELADLTRALGRKFWKGRVIAPEQKEL
jgi:peptidoglycan biosynthesis protein MviN/MurJ (putative lipid II flippase)